MQTWDPGRIQINIPDPQHCDKVPGTVVSTHKPKKGYKKNFNRTFVLSFNCILEERCCLHQRFFQPSLQSLKCLAAAL
jgi:hypothetical protein